MSGTPSPALTPRKVHWGRDHSGQYSPNTVFEGNEGAFDVASAAVSFATLVAVGRFRRTFW